MNLKKITARHEELDNLLTGLSRNLKTDATGRLRFIHDLPLREFDRFLNKKQKDVSVALSMWPTYCAESAIVKLIDDEPDAAQSIVQAIAWRSLCYQEFAGRWKPSDWKIPSEVELAQTLMHAMVLGWPQVTDRLGKLALQLGERALDLVGKPDPNHQNPPFHKIHDGSAFPLACTYFQIMSGRESRYRGQEHLPDSYKPLVRTLYDPDGQRFAEAVEQAAAHHLAMAVPYMGTELGVVRDYRLSLDALFPVEIFVAIQFRRSRGLEVRPLSGPWLAETHAYFATLPRFEPDELYVRVTRRLSQAGFVYASPST